MDDCWVKIGLGSGFFFFMWCTVITFSVSDFAALRDYRRAMVLSYPSY